MICIRWSLFRRDDAIPAALWPQSRVRESARPSDSGLRGGLCQRSVGDYLWWQLGRPGRLRRMSHGGTQSVSTAHICCLVHPLLNQSVSQSVSLFFFSSSFFFFFSFFLFFSQSVSFISQPVSFIGQSKLHLSVSQSFISQSASFIHPSINVIYLSFSLMYHSVCIVYRPFKISFIGQPFIRRYKCWPLGLLCISALVMCQISSY